MRDFWLRNGKWKPECTKKSLTEKNNKALKISLQKSHLNADRNFWQLWFLAHWQIVIFFQSNNAIIKFMIFWKIIIFCRSKNFKFPCFPTILPKTWVESKKQIPLNKAQKHLFWNFLQILFRALGAYFPFFFQKKNINSLLAINQHASLSHFLLMVFVFNIGSLEENWFRRKDFFCLHNIFFMTSFLRIMSNSPFPSKLNVKI
jgi:hypothetical protein